MWVLDVSIAVREMEIRFLMMILPLHSVEVIHRYRTRKYINEAPRGKFEHGSLGEDLNKVRENYRKGVAKNVR